MNSLVKIGVTLLVGLFLLSGCASKPAPTPGETRMGDPTRPGSPDWIDGQAYQQGLDGSRAGALDSYSGDPDLLSRGAMAGGALAGDGEVLETVYFGFDEYSVRSSERPKLEAAADYLRANPNARLVAEGHTDWIGTTQYNLGLGDRRANAVKTYLVQLGIRGDRVEILSMGELQATQGLDRNDPLINQDRKVVLILAE